MYKQIVHAYTQTSTHTFMSRNIWVLTQFQICLLFTKAYSNYTHMTNMGLKFRLFTTKLVHGFKKRCYLIRATIFFERLRCIWTN